MLEPWNNRSILQPPINTAACKHFEFKILKNICNTIIHVLSKQSPLHKESAIFSRFLYKFDKKFRNDIGYRYFKKVNVALRSYLRLPLIKDVHSFMEALPITNETILAPTKQMLEYVLIRLMTFCKLMYRVTLCSKQAAVFYLNRIKRGESHWMCLMPFALLSRVWSMAFVLLQHSCNWYNQLFPTLNKLEYKGLKFLPDQYSLPSNLEDWIDMKYLNNAGRFQWSQKFITNFDSIVDEDDEEGLYENILKFVDNINKKTKDVEPDTQLLLPKQDVYTKFVPKQNNNDQGEAISRESFKSFMANLPPVLTNPSVNIVRQDHCIKNVCDQDSLNEFIENEETYRSTSHEDKSLTSHLTFMQWQALKNSLLKLNCSFMNKKKVEMKVQIIWKEKCLEYM
ncbi:nucleolus and neural progenitor protein-like [Vanessa atalanta]|uniref:nucleolus and neural progenitor protein-like n=1 Tax=Vanessa atalanta TaxID=42275 RepID=UPI001FCDE272|nr:nucleolus and neural progenitor protein-like [Vanessa atalanta]